MKAAQELEQGQRITADKKREVHDELIKKATAIEVSESCNLQVAMSSQ